MTTTTAVHASMKWDWLAHLTASLTQLRADTSVSLIGLTELEPLRDASVRGRVTADGWDFYRGPDRPGKRECAVTWRTSAWTAAGLGHVKLLSKEQYRRANGRLQPHFYATVQPLTHRETTKTTAVVVLHAPLRNTPKRTEVSEEVLWSLAVWLPRLAAKYDHVLVLADWNIPMRGALAAAKGRPSLRRLAEQTDLRLAWDGHVAGQAGRKTLIDGALTTHNVAGSRLLPAIAASDHLPVAVLLDLDDAIVRPSPPRRAVPKPPAIRRRRAARERQRAIRARRRRRALRARRRRARARARS